MRREPGPLRNFLKTFVAFRFFGSSYHRYVPALWAPDIPVCVPGGGSVLKATPLFWQSKKKRAWVTHSRTLNTGNCVGQNQVAETYDI